MQVSSSPLCRSSSPNSGLQRVEVFREILYIPSAGKVMSTVFWNARKLPGKKENNNQGMLGYIIGKTVHFWPVK